MFEHILVPTDITEKSLRALDIAVQMAIQNVSRVTLLHVIETIADTEYNEFEDFYEKLKIRSQEKMDEIVLKFKNEKIDIENRLA